MRSGSVLPILFACPTRSFFRTAILSVFLLSSVLPAYSERAGSADVFVDSVGINVHLHHLDTAYSNFNRVEQSLKALHIRHIRDGLIDTTWLDYYNRHNQLGRSGIKATFITSPTQPSNLLLEYPQRMKDSFEAYEAPNEYDQNGGANWSTTLANFLTRLNQTVKGDSRVSRFPIIGPSLTRADSFVKVRGACTFDYSNLHDYFAGRNPGTAGWGSNGYGSIAWNLANTSTACPGKPVVATETGYQTGATSAQNLPEDVAVKYVPRLFLEQWLRGIRRTYLYELIDLPKGRGSGDSGFGLMRSDFSPKPAYTALMNLLRLLSDPGGSFSTVDLPVQITGDLTNVHHAIFQKRNGSFYLAFWVEEPCYDVDSKKVLTVRPRQIVIHTNKQTGSFLHSFDKFGALTSKPLEPNVTYPVEATDSVRILEISSRPPPPIMNAPVVSRISRTMTGSFIS